MLSSGVRPIFLLYANQQLFKMVSRCFKIIIVNTYLVKIKDIINMASKIYYFYICLGNSRNDYLCTLGIQKYFLEAIHDLVF